MDAGSIRPRSARRSRATTASGWPGRGGGAARVASSTRTTRSSCCPRWRRPGHRSEQPGFAKLVPGYPRCVSRFSVRMRDRAGAGSASPGGHLHGVDDERSRTPSRSRWVFGDVGGPQLIRRFGVVGARSGHAQDHAHYPDGEAVCGQFTDLRKHRFGRSTGSPAGPSTAVCRTGPAPVWRSEADRRLSMWE